MDNKKFNKNLLDRLKKEDIKQIPKYIFVFKNIVIWFFLIISIFLGSVSLGISLDYIINADWYLFKKIGLFKVFVVFLPIFWIIFLVFSSFLSYYNYRHTDKGYKLSLLRVFSFNIVLSFILALLLYFTGTNIYIESKLEDYFPKYRSVLVDDKVTRMVKVWQNEEQGLLIGKILDVGKNKFTFQDFNNKYWDIILDNKTTTDVKHRVNIQFGEKIKIIGEKVNDSSFKAFEIRPFMGKGR